MNFLNSFLQRKGWQKKKHIDLNSLVTLFLTERKEWCDWLHENFNGAKDIWLVYPKKSSGKARISYNDAVEEALCFGWIDSTIKSLDENHTIQRFTKRRPKSKYSQANKKSLKWLAKEKMLHPSIAKITRDIINGKLTNQRFRRH